MKPYRIGSLLAFFIGVSPILGQAGEADRALIIGIGHYQDPRASALKGVVHDMESAKKIAKAMGISDGGIKYLRDSQATKENIIHALDGIGGVVGDGGRVLIYFSGHGTRDYDPVRKSCSEGLLTYESGVITDRELAVATKKINQSADKMIVMLDACHSGGVAPSAVVAGRSIATEQFIPKFSMKSGGESCSKVSNIKGRGGLLDESTRLGALEENFIQITSARPDEVSFDNENRGGLATAAVRDCMLGKAADSDHSGAISIAEVQKCAQDYIDTTLKGNTQGLEPHHVTVAGNKKLIPVHHIKPPLAISHQVSEPPIQAVVTPVSVSSVQSIPPPAVADEPTDALATLEDIISQRNPRRKVQVKTEKSILKIGQDPLSLNITSSHDGYVYLVLLGSDKRSFYILFPNGLDKNNRIQAGQAMKIPRKNWQVKASGPVGIDHLLVMVTDSPRKLDQFNMAPSSAEAPFTYALNDLPGRGALIDFLVGSGTDGKSTNFGAQLLKIEERL